MDPGLEPTTTGEEVEKPTKETGMASEVRKIRKAWSLGSKVKKVDSV